MEATTEIPPSRDTIPCPHLEHEVSEAEALSYQAQEIRALRDRLAKAADRVLELRNELQNALTSSMPDDLFHGALEEIAGDLGTLHRSLTPGDLSP